MKKIILTGVFAVLCAPAFAQASLYKGFFPSGKSLVNCIKGICSSIATSLTQASAPASKVTWVREVQRMEGEKHTVQARNFTVKEVPTDAKPAIMGLREAFGQNRAIGNYKFLVPEPADVSGLTQNQLAFVTGFLRQPIEAEAFNTDYMPVITHPTKSAPETQLIFEVDGKRLILLVNSTRNDKRVYFFANEVPEAAAANENTNSALQYTNGRNLNGHLTPSF